MTDSVKKGAKGSDFSRFRHRSNSHIPAKNQLRNRSSIHFKADSEVRATTGESLTSPYPIENLEKQRIVEKKRKTRIAIGMRFGLEHERNISRVIVKFLGILRYFISVADSNSRTMMLNMHMNLLVCERRN